MIHKLRSLFTIFTRKKEIQKIDDTLYYFFYSKRRSLIRMEVGCSSKKEYINGKIFNFKLESKRCDDFDKYNQEYDKHNNTCTPKYHQVWNEDSVYVGTGTMSDIVIN
jgi:hypothetical protein